MKSVGQRLILLCTAMVLLLSFSIDIFYNAMPVEGVERLVAFMKEFEAGR